MKERCRHLDHDFRAPFYVRQTPARLLVQKHRDVRVHPEQLDVCVAANKLDIRVERPKLATLQQCLKQWTRTKKQKKKQRQRQTIPRAPTLSRMRKRRSNLDRRELGRLIFSLMARRLLYLPYRGFAAANTAARAFRVVVMPAFAILTVCCSITCTGVFPPSGGGEAYSCFGKS